MLIGLCGYPMTGKSEVTKILVEQYGFEVLDTKTILRDMASTLTGIDAKEFSTQEGKAKLFHGVSLRRIMGELGNVAENLWGDDFMLRQALRVAPIGKRIVVDALRKDQTRYFDGLVYQVISNRGLEPKEAHDRFYQGRTDGIIVNDGTLSDLSDTVKRVFKL